MNPGSIPPQATMQLISDVAEAQEAEYWFPYHYVAQMPASGFTGHFVDTWGINYISTIEFILSEISRLTATSVVDIGCGDGRLTRELALRSGMQRCVGVDYSLRAINLARAMNQDVPAERLKYVAADITKQDAHLGTFDVAILMEVFEHIPPAEAHDFLRGVRNLMRPGSRLLLTVPHTNKPVEYKHFQHFDVASITSYLSPHFKIARIVPFEKRSPARNLLAGMMSNRFFVLNNRRALSLIYGYYMRHLFKCDSETQCQRLYVEAQLP
jgi:SAM-dependent methyltransferase